MTYNKPLSHSSISMYLECPQKWKFKYLDKIPEEPKWFFSFGQSVHKALEFFYDIKMLPPPSLEDILAFYKKHWKTVGYKDARQEKEYFAEGERILKGFYDKHIPTFRLPFFAEYQFHLDVDGVPVTGFVDRIDKLDSGNLAVVDYKTGKAFDLERVEQDAQLTMYQMACEEKLGLKVESLTFYHLPSLTPLTVGPHAEGQVRDLRKRIVHVSGEIQAGRFEPKPEERKCQWCDYRPHCPVFRHLYVTHGAEAEGAPQAELPMAPPKRSALTADKNEDDLLVELVDRYGKLREQAHELEASSEDLKAEIVELLRKKGYVKAFGGQYEVGVHFEDKWEFADKTRVLDVLRSHGLYDKVLKPSAPEVQKLMADAELPSEVRQDLERLGEKKRHSTLRFKRIDSEHLPVR